MGDAGHMGQSLDMKGRPLGESGYFVDRQVSVLRALMIYGMDESPARELIALTRRSGGTDYRIDQAGARYLIRQMKGYHADVFRLDDCTSGSDSHAR